MHSAETVDCRHQALARHAVDAVAVGDSQTAVPPGTTAYTVNTRLQANGIGRTEVTGWDNAVKVGDRLRIWVDAQGNRVAAPTLIHFAGTDATTAAAVAWLMVTLVAETASGKLRVLRRRFLGLGLGFARSVGESFWLQGS